MYFCTCHPKTQNSLPLNKDKNKLGHFTRIYVLLYIMFRLSEPFFKK